VAEIFINYRRKQSLSDAQHLATLLTSDFGKNSVFIDVRNIDSCSDWLEQLQTKVSNCKVLISIIGPDWLEALDEKDYPPGERSKDLVRYEIAEALRLRIPVLPVMLNGTPVPPFDKLPVEIRDIFRRRVMDLRNEHFIADAAAITAELKKIIRSQRGLPRTRVSMLVAAALVLGIFTGPLILPHPGGSLLGPVRNPDEALRQENLQAMRLVTETEISRNSLAEHLKAAKARADDAEAKLGLLEAKIKNKQQEAEDVKVILANEQKNSIAAAKKIQVLVYQIEGLKRSLAEEKRSISKLVEQLQSKNEQIIIKDRQIAHLQSFIDGVSVFEEATVTSSLKAITVPEPQTLNGHSGWVHAAGFSPNHRYLVSGSWDNTLRVWDRESRREVLPPLKGHLDKIHDVAFSTDGQLIVSASADKTLRLWNANTGDEIQSLEDHWHGVLAATFSPTGDYILSGGKDKRLIVWGTQKGNIRWNSQTDRENGKLAGHTGDITDVAFSPDGRLFLSASRDATIKLWNFENDAASEKKTFNQHTGAVNTAAFSADGRHIVSGSDDKTLKIWDVATGQATTLSGHEGPIHSAAFSPDGRYVVSASEDGTLRLWHWKTKQFWTFEKHTDPIYVAGFSADGRFVVSGGNDKLLKLWDVSAWTHLKAAQKTDQ
jgi:WD40 repeat protein